MTILDSYIQKAVKSHYEKKYTDLPKNQKDKKVEEHLRALLPSGIKGMGISKSQKSSMGYGAGLENAKIEQELNESGYRLVYDSFSEGLEPIYFWVLDFMRDTYWGTGLDVTKAMDRFEASAGSGFFGDLGTRASILQDRAMKLMTTINAVTRSVINILYDLKEFDQRLQLYKDLEDDDKKDDARLALKQFWMDKVDVQRGRASINMLSQQLQFVTMRDAFMVANSAEEVSKPVKDKGMDLNERVKRILAPRIADYLVWERLSGKELERRYKIERSYLKSQVESLRLYAQWAKPYFQASQKLGTNITDSPDLVTTFNNLQVQTTLLGMKKMGDLYSYVEVGFDFRTIPHTMRQSQAGVHYVQGGRADLQFRGFALNEEEKEALEKYELNEGLQMANVNDEMIKEIEESISEYMKGEEKEFEDPRERLGFLQELVEKTENKDIRKNVREDIEKLKKEIKAGKKEPGPFTALFDNFKGSSDSIKVLNVLKQSRKDKDKEGTKEARFSAAKAAVGNAYVIYLVYKKAHGMYTE